MKKNNILGFTLIELLAVIVILAIIAVIATPLAINVINDSKERSFINSAYGLIDGVRLLSAEQLLKEESNEVVVQFTNGTSDNTDFKVSGEIPTSGTIYISTDGKVELKVWSEDLGKCAEKSADESEVKFTETTKENCKIEIKRCSKVVLGKTITTGDIACEDPDLNTRYVGEDPNNYVYFNKDENGNPEKWRIIGIFNGQAKIIKHDYYSYEMYWNTNDSNDWTTSSLKDILNNETTGYLKTIETNDPTSYNYIDLTHVWNIGAASTWTSKPETRIRSNLYTAERSDTKAGTTSAPTTWEGAIGLMYPSDFGYSTSGDVTICDTTMSDWHDDDIEEECPKNSWLKDEYNFYTQWTITPSSVTGDTVLTVEGSGFMYADYVGDWEYAVRPTLYLNKNVKIKGGQGTFDQPYELGINVIIKTHT